MPTLAVITMSSLRPASTMGLETASSSRRATMAVSSADRTAAKKTMNSSPSTRPMASRSLRQDRIRRAISLSTTSPTPWPMVSLTNLKLSMSR